jgi:hypothetical protein
MWHVAGHVWNTRSLAAALACTLLLVGCTSRTPHGDCIGLNGEEKPGLRYEYSAWNIAMGILFVELIFPPIDVALNKFKCPVAAR